MALAAAIFISSFMVVDSVSRAPRTGTEMRGRYLSGLGWKQFDTTQKYSILSTSYCPISYDSAKKVKAVLVK
jgi:hypothetical protein